MSANIIPITNGRVVYFVPNGYANIVQHDPKVPLTAHVCHVWNDYLVNLDVIDSTGTHHAVLSVEFIQPGEPKPEGTHFAHWMQYQIGQAQKYEAEAAKNSPTAPLS
jgi:hypothetical protein